MSQQEENPFQAPAAYEVATPAMAPDLPPKPPNVGWIFGKWFAICCISAAPSFMFGLTVSTQRASQIAGMLAGIAIFICVYTAFECSKFGQQLVSSRLVRIVSRIGYGMRMLISVVFPLGALIDIPTGLLSISIANFLFGTGIQSGRHGFDIENPGLTFIWYLSTTIFQGIFLNIILLIFMVIMYGIGLLFGAQNHSSNQT